MIYIDDILKLIFSLNVEHPYNANNLYEVQ